MPAFGRDPHLCHAILESLGAGVVVADVDRRIVFWNDAATSIVGMGAVDCPPVEWPMVYGVYRSDGQTPLPVEELPLLRALRGETISDDVYVLRNASRPDGVLVSVSAGPVRDEAGNTVAGVAVFHDVRPHVEAMRRARDGLGELVLERTSKLEQEIARRRGLEAAYRQLFELNPHPMWVFDVETLRFLAVNEAALTLYGYTRDEFLGMTLRDLRLEEDQPALEAAVREDWLGYKRPRLWRHRKKDGSLLHVEVSRSDVTFEERAARVVLIQDVTERQRLEQQLLHSQKMEAIGRLAGGISHDFNNILTAVLSFAGFAREALPADHPAAADLDEVLAAGRRATALTRQLLAFSRQQVTQPKVVDINELVLGLDKMLRRTLGADVELVTIPMAKGQTRIDPGHFEQVLMNLAINARDAMTAGGKLIVETADVFLDAEYVRTHSEAQEGEHVMLAVSDTGVGMTEDVRTRIFEPFFTTKPHGKGTGLGLSTCYGIVKQAGGNIWVYSELGRGTTFKIYLPRCDDNADTPGRERPVPGLSVGGHERILVAEDDPKVRESVVRMLELLGYAVLQAEDAGQAFDLASRVTGSIHLLLTDIVMPGTGGRKLAARIRQAHPAARVLYMSGYTDDAVIHHGELEQGVAFLQKPFTPDVLARKVREVLDGL